MFKCWVDKKIHLVDKSVSYCKNLFSSILIVKTLSNAYIFTNPYARAGYDTRSIFKWSLTGLN